MCSPLLQTVLAFLSAQTSLLWPLSNVALPEDLSIPSCLFPPTPFWANPSNTPADQEFLKYSHQLANKSLSARFPSFSYLMWILPEDLDLYPPVPFEKLLNKKFFSFFFFSLSLLGAFVAKFSRPQKRCSGILFSPKAVVCEVEGQRCLMFRVCNLLARPLVDVCVSAVLYEEQDDHTIRQTALDFLLDGLGSRPCPLFLSPLTFFHPLTPDSPLNRAMPQSGQAHFELVVFLSASQEGTGSAYHKRTSYLADEIQYGRRFTKAVQHGERRNSIQAMRFFDTHICPLMGPNTYSNSRDKECVIQVNGDGNDAME